MRDSKTPRNNILDLEIVKDRIRMSTDTKGLRNVAIS